jgi:import inner membrane translocase subunit TIM16
MRYVVRGQNKVDIDWPISIKGKNTSRDLKIELAALRHGFFFADVPLPKTRRKVINRITLSFTPIQSHHINHHGTSIQSATKIFYFLRRLDLLISTVSQAHRIITTLVLTGSRVFGRAFAEAYKQASASSKYASEMKKGNVTGASTYASSGLTLDEACKILNVKPPQAAAGGEAQLESVMERFKKLFDINDPEKGGSFYLQSKILRARERIEMELRETERKAATDKELKEGWKPKVYKDR